MYLGSKYKREEEFIVINDNDIDLKPINFKLPDIPNDKDILFNNLQQSEQYFRKTEFPERLKLLINRISREVDSKNRNIKSGSKKLIFNDEINREIFRDKEKYADIHRFIMQEFHRRLHGLWFFNNGIRTYISGKMYMWLNYWVLDVGLPVYRDKDRRYFHFLTEAIKDKDCYGILEMTRRKEGKSVRSAFSIIDEMTLPFNFNRHCGMQSKNDGDAQDLFKKAILGWKNLPFFFQPIHSHLNSDPQNILKLTANVGQSTEILELGNWLDYRAAKALAYDSTYLLFYISDEEGKLELVDAQERWAKVKPALVNPFGEITGKSIHTTTVEDGGMYGFDSFKKLWDGSSYHERNELGQTKSGLWRIFFPAYDGLIIDKHGISNIEQAKKELKIERKSESEGTKNYFELVRKKPFTVRECFTVSADKCPFDKSKILKRIEDFFNGNRYLIQGDFVWKNGVKDSEVEFIENPNGRFIVSYLPSINERNKFEIIGKIKKPYNRNKFIAGGDTFNFDITEGEGSKGGGAVFMAENPILEKILWEKYEEHLDEEEKNRLFADYKSHRFVCTYNYRPPTKEEYVEDMIKMCFFYGCYMFPELNFDHIQKGFERRGYAGYLLHRYDEKRRKLKDNAGDVTNNTTKDGIFAAVQEYIVSGCQYETHDDFLKQCLRVSYQTMTDFDLFSACAYALYGHAMSKIMIEREVQRKRATASNETRKWYAEQQVL